MGVINLIVPIKWRQIKQNSQEWFDGEVAEKISVRDKFFQKYKNPKLYTDKEIYKVAQYEVQKLIAYKKKLFLRIYSMILLVNLKGFGRLWYP